MAHFGLPPVETRVVATAHQKCDTCGKHPNDFRPRGSTYRLSEDDGKRYCGRHIEQALVAAGKGRL